MFTRDFLTSIVALVHPRVLAKERNYASSLESRCDLTLRSHLALDVPVLLADLVALVLVVVAVLVPVAISVPFPLTISSPAVLPRRRRVVTFVRNPLLVLVLAWGGARRAFFVPIPILRTAPVPLLVLVAVAAVSVVPLAVPIAVPVAFFVSASSSKKQNSENTITSSERGFIKIYFNKRFDT
jgi:hypothetical protein